ncbi:DL-endopeptidase inhibitor IseA family protein [Hathewaya limosa]|uniref:Lipopolysaccharide export LptBFGC system permease protein LptF n=1 Tax=Hathewaya limosa TaxID=1536 RepID=A0ABU0JTH2_HATLI|nr:DL-endopeptidase inhibitor IseA family protein [Hathewaya limosa]MDQ0480392.1 lipopolysaccharide export LptBFGC system permease protein LptF [Hathewaya limosa]
MKKNKVIILLTVLIICSSTVPILAKEGFKKTKIEKQPSKVELSLKKDQEKNIIAENVKKDDSSNKKIIKDQSNNVTSSKTNVSNSINKTQPDVKHSVNKKVMKSNKIQKKNILNTTKQKKVMATQSNTKKIVKNNYDKYNFLISMCNDANKLLLDINKKSIDSNCKIVPVKNEEGESWDYGRIKSPYATIKDFESKLNEYFTKNYINNLENSRFYKNIDDEPYFLIGQAGLKSYYNYTSIINISCTKDTIVAKCNAEIPSWNKYKGDVTLKLEDGKWKIDSFDSVLN